MAWFLPHFVWLMPLCLYSVIKCYGMLWDIFLFLLFPTTLGIPLTPSLFTTSCTLPTPSPGLLSPQPPPPPPPPHTHTQYDVHVENSSSGFTLFTIISFCSCHCFNSMSVVWSIRPNTASQQFHFLKPTSTLVKLLPFSNLIFCSLHLCKFNKPFAARSHFTLLNPRL